jgi:glycosyltransferase involved in cell wall biosynthesis
VRVLHIVESLDERVGGPLRFVLDLSAAGVRYGMKSEVAGPGPYNVRDVALTRDAIHAFHVSSPERYAYSPEFASWLESHVGGFDGVVLHGMWLYPHWRTARTCVKSGTPYVCCPHGMLEPWAIRAGGAAKALKKLLYWCWRERGIYNNTHRLIYMTQREQHEARKLPGVAKFESSVLPIPALEWPHDSAGVTPASRSKFCLFLGRVHPHKNIEFLLRSWAKASPDPEWRLIIAGPADSGYGQSLMDLAAMLQVQEQVQFTGFVAGEDKRYLLRHAAWFVLPSHHENFGVAVVEAVQHGCAAAVSNQVYLSDYLSRPSEVLPLDEAAWTEFFSKRMSDNCWRQAVAKRNFSDIQAQCGFHATERWVSTLRKIFLGMTPAETARHSLTR